MAHMEKLLLHTCCADCMLKFVDSKEYEVVAYYYNPNIHPRTEYLARLQAIQKVTTENKVPLIIPDWSPKEYFGCFTGSNQKLTDKSATRCPHCWVLRLTQTAKYAKENNYINFSTTLLSSHYQDFDLIVRIGRKLEKEFGVKFKVPQLINCDLKTGGFYKQNYCGCIYSLKDRMEEKFLGKINDLDSTCG